MAAVQLAKNILAADGQPFTTLSLAEGLPPVTSETSIPEARRNYMRLAGVIHPDRLQSSFDKATEAFQCLVRAFECFADPKLRKQAAAAAKKLGKAKDTASETVRERCRKATSSRSSPASPTSSKSEKSKTAASKARVTSPLKKSKKTVKRKAEESEPELTDREGESDSEGGASDGSAADEEEWATAWAEPEVSTNRTPIGKPRVGGVYQPTTVGCPKCRSLWESDSRPQYSLFMGHWGKKVHCQLCLFQFGCATALHACPHCSVPFEYDVSMYDTVQTCQRCRKPFGFPYYPVSQHLIDQVALEEWRERMDRQKASEREARAKARRGGASDEASAAEEEMQLLIGTCIMEERCPLCNKRVKSNHRAHVGECKTKTREAPSASTEKKNSQSSKTTPSPKRSVKTTAPKVAKTAPEATTRAPTSGVSKAATAPSSPRAPRPKCTTTKGKKATAPPRRKRRRDDTDSSDGEDVSDSDEDETSSESSFDDDDDSDE